jgi:phosphoribosylglycinamide formyltransferase-1
VKYTGCTVHFVDDKCDHGAVIEQTVFPLTGSESVAECETMGIKIENEFYPKILQKIFYEKWKIQELKNQRPRLVFDV